MLETEFVLELLVRLFTDPSGLDRGGKRLEDGIGRQVRHTVFLLYGRAPFADEPDFFTRHCLDATIEHAMPMACTSDMVSSFNSATPARTASYDAARRGIHMG